MYNSFTLPLALQDKIVPEPMSGCWLWIAAQDPKGYGRVGRKRWGEGMAHRLVAGLLRRPVPPNLNLCHHCDTPACVNPAHTFEGTDLDNVRDCIRKGRFSKPFGEATWEARLTDEDVIAIRKSDDTGAALARKYGVGLSTITFARSGRNWSHLNNIAPPKRYFRILSPVDRAAILVDARPIAEIAREYGLAYQSVWGLKRRWSSRARQ